MSKKSSNRIDPLEWLAAWKVWPSRAATAATTESVTEFIPGTMKPARVGYYERMFTDGLYRQWWDGKLWRFTPGGLVHWRQVGDYPCWRGLAKKPATKDAA